tara:strand:- start:920 stop:1666 length:747 start_codon:yes stop_codon:yes gene_type:complete
MKYISYSVWGGNRVYTYGIIENVLDAKKYYEGWVVRVHYNDTVPANVIDWLKKQDNVEVIHHPGTKTKASNTLWRFDDLFIEDATVISRDADSRFTDREVELVNEWLQSTKDFHIIRDHKHHMVPILAGTFGCRNNCLKYIGLGGELSNINSIPMRYVNGLELLNHFKNGIPTSRDKYLVDQIFLAQYVYNYIISNTMIHCSHNAYEPTAKRIDPVDVGFVGEVITECPRAAEILGDSVIKYDRVGAY